MMGILSREFNEPGPKRREKPGFSGKTLFLETRNILKLNLPEVQSTSNRKSWITIYLKGVQKHTWQDIISRNIQKLNLPTIYISKECKNTPEKGFSNGAKKDYSTHLAHKKNIQEYPGNTSGESEERRAFLPAKDYCRAAATYKKQWWRRGGSMNT